MEVRNSQIVGSHVNRPVVFRVLVSLDFGIKKVPPIGH